MTIIQVIWEAEVGELQIESRSRQLGDSCLKKGEGCLGVVVEHLNT